MKKPNDTIVTESKAAFTLKKYIEDNNITDFDYREMKEKMVFLYHKKYKGDSGEAFRYFKYIYGHAIKLLKKKGKIIETSKYKYKIQKANYIDDDDIKDNFKWKVENTISKIYKYVGDRKHLLPSFQRMTSWKSKNDYIELAYSIFKSTPLGIMYFWKITKEEAINIKHYRFKRDIISSQEMNFKQMNINEYNHEYILSIIDGQQRITGINVIVNGTFNGEHMYFNDNELGSKKFKFLKDGEKLEWHSIESIYSELRLIFDGGKNLQKNLKILASKKSIKLSSLKMFYKGFFEARLLAVCEISNAELEDVLELFIRTNKFGKKLSPADIVLSNIIGKDLKINARKKIEKLTKVIRGYKSNYSFSSVLKLISTYFTKNAKMNHNTFSHLNKELNNELFLVKNNKSWEILEKSIWEVGNLLKKYNFDSKWINSDNSLIPIIYWHSRYGNGKIIRNDMAIKNILNYLLWAQLLRQFRGSTDNKINQLILELDNSEFKGWKLGTNTQESNKLELIEQLDNFRYGNENDEAKIRILLSFNQKVWRDADSFEHLWPQSKGGGNSIWNLALLPKLDNIELGNKTIREKIDKLKKIYNFSEEEILDKLWLTKSLIYENHHSQNYDKFIKERKNLMMDLISKYIEQ